MGYYSIVYTLANPAGCRGSKKRLEEWRNYPRGASQP